MRYTIEYGGEQVAVDVTEVEPDRYRVQIGDAPARTVRARVGDGLVHLLDGVESVTVVDGARGDGRHIRARGLDATLQVLDERTARIRARQAGGGSGRGANVVATPMPGRVVKVLVAEGEEVEIGQGVVIVEAMKMENELRAEAAGRVEAIHVAAGDLVEGNAELVILELLDE